MQFCTTQQFEGNNHKTIYFYISFKLERAQFTREFISRNANASLRLAAVIETYRCLMYGTRFSRRELQLPASAFKGTYVSIFALDEMPLASGIRVRIPFRTERFWQKPPSYISPLYKTRNLGISMSIMVQRAPILLRVRVRKRVGSRGPGW